MTSSDTGWSGAILLLGAWYSFVNYGLLTVFKMKLFYSFHIFHSSFCSSIYKRASHYKIRITQYRATNSFLCNSLEKIMQFPTRFLQCEENNIIHLCFGFSIYRICIQHYSITKEFHYNLAYCCYVNSDITQATI